jgi:hypothetical protein
MSKDSVRASGAEGPGRLGEGRVYADIYRHGTNPRSTRKYFRGFTVRAYFQCALHCYSDAWSTIVQRFSTVLLSFEGPKPRQYPSARAIGPILNRPRSRWRMARSPAWCETSPSSLRGCASTPFIPVPLATAPQ